jgi:putative endonuclease
MTELWYVYLLECNDSSLYCGITTDVKRRFKEHVNGTGSKYVRSKGAKKIVWSKLIGDKSKASIVEANIKKLPRIKKLSIINSDVIVHL